MRLIEVELHHVKSVRGTLTLAVDPRITVLLGANDHGKSNILQSLSRLNDGEVFEEDDRNWDTSPDDFPNTPAVFATFELTEEEVAALGSLTPPPIDDEPTPPTFPEGQGCRTFRFGKVGIPGLPTVNGRPLSEFPPPLVTWLQNNRPQFTLVSSFSGETQDHVDAATIQDPTAEFMQGIFFQAGLSEADWKYIFAQNDRTMKRLDQASTTLNMNLKGLWGQGADLDFFLRHDNGKISLRVRDPAVDDRLVRLSQKSTGVTHFFRLSMVLHARKMKTGSKPLLYLFDEPGVHLHPKGQRDLLRVLELIADKSQILIATHSLFLINLNYPERHRLVFLDERGTRVDHKPYTASWKMATDALGLSLGALSLFSEKVLLVEGETDPLFLYEAVRQLNLLGRIAVDVNDLGIVSFRDVQTLKYLIQLLSQDPANPKTAVLLDGDNAGSATKKAVKPLCETHGVPCFILEQGRSIEDHCLDMDEFATAVIGAVAEARRSERMDAVDGLESILQERLSIYRPWTRTGGTGGEFETLGRALKKMTHEVADVEVSKVAVARRYVETCREKLRPASIKDNEAAFDTERVDATLRALREISQYLALPEQKASERILADN